MFDSDLSVVGEALKVSADKYESKGLKSVRSRVTNIKPYVSGEMSIHEFQEILKKNMIQGESVEMYQLTQADLTRIREIQEERYNTWEWNFGASPEYKVRLLSILFPVFFHPL